MKNDPRTESYFDPMAQLDHIMPAAITGRVVRTVGMTAAAAGLPAPVGAVVQIERQGAAPILGEVIGFHENLTLVYPLSGISGVCRGNRVRLVRTCRRLAVGDELLGRVIDAQGQPIDRGPLPVLPARTPLDRPPPAATSRPRIDTPISTGIRAIDGLLTCGQGQRMGIFSGSGVGKSVSLGMMARYTSADVIVIALIGERGREVNEFIERDLGPAGLAKSVVVVATSDQPALLRVQSGFTATCVAEHFRDQGRRVLLLVDSVTRFAMAQREIGLAAGEPPTTRGYPPSVFALLPRLVERAGRTQHGSITAFYAVLVEGDDLNEPVGDAVRGLLDGHTVLSRRLAGKGHYPAIDVLESISRLMPEITDQQQRHATTVVRQLLAALRDNEDLVSVGAYRPGSNPTLDLALAMQHDIDLFLQQSTSESSTTETARQQLLELVAKCATLRTATAPPSPAAATKTAAHPAMTKA
jgi:flagellum-specific ATP synthase